MASNESKDIIAEIKKKVRFDELFLELFPEKHRQGGNSYCPMPGHDDRTPSFQVESDHGFCHAGCTPGNGSKAWDIISLWRLKHGCDHRTAVRGLAHCAGIDLPDASIPKKGLRLEDAKVVYDYEDQDETIKFKVARFEPKTFRPFTRDGKGQWTQGMKDVPRLLFRLPRLLSARDHEWIIFLEGEKDVQTAEALGYFATTSPGGANGWQACVKDGAHEALRDRQVLVIPDRDTAGEKYAEDVATTLRLICRSLKVASLPGGKDLSDYVRDHGEEAARQKVLALASETPDWKLPRTGPEIVTCKELLESDLNPPRWIIQDLLPEGLGLLAAKAKSGKSWLCQNLAVAVARGGQALGNFPAQEAGVLCLCLEDNKRRMRERLSMILEGTSPPEAHLIACEWPHLMKGGMDLLHKHLEDNPSIKLVIIDTWSRFRGRRSSNEDAYHGDYADLQELHSLASLYQTGILLIHHLRKETSEDPLDGILGSTALSGACDFIHILRRKNRTDSSATLFVTGRDLVDQEHALSFQSGIWRYEGDPRELALTAQRKEIRRVFAAEGKPLTAKDVWQCLETKQSYDAVYKLCSRMVESGDLQRAAGQKHKFVLPPEDEMYVPTWAPRSRYGEACLDRI